MDESRATFTAVTSVLLDNTSLSLAGMVAVTEGFAIKVGEWEFSNKLVYII